MKTKNLRNGLKITAILIVIIITFGKSKAQSAYDDAVSSSNNSAVSEFIAENLKIDLANATKNEAEVKDWIENELNYQVQKNHLSSTKLSTKLFLEIGKDGKIANYSFDGMNSEVGQLIEKVLKAAPKFQPLTMNGYTAKMNYEIPVTVVIK
jgi:hypothetical protein